MLNESETRNYVFRSDLSENQEAINRKLAYASKELRQALLRDSWESREGKTSAAIEIQRAWRGYQARGRIFGSVNQGVSKTAVYSGSQHYTTRDEDFQQHTASGKEKRPSRLRLEHYYQDFISQLMDAEDRPDPLPSFDDFCATYIQDWWRDVHHSQPHRPPSQREIHQQQMRQHYRQQQQQQRTPRVVAPQTQKRQEPTPVVPKRPPRLPNAQEAATMIQRAWRRHIDIQVYRYYRDLINFKTRGNPSLMLRCINPQEAKILDAASGIHIKFRLAGDRFPPNIYYKIYTHRPIQDLCANSPKDYTKPAVKLKMAKDVHNKGRLDINPRDMAGWYKRMDNNGWRLVSDRLIRHVMSDPVTWESSQKKYEYNHDKLVRKQDVEKRKKKKKIDWMKKMYKEGMLKAKADDKETIQLIEGAAAGMVATVENYGTDALEDWEVDELLDWTTSLNFDDYQNGWKELATSAHSEKQIEDKLRLLTSTGDPYEFTLSTGPSRYQSTQQSRNTPVSSVSSAGRQEQAVS